jgi:hypothetical protein
MEEQRLLSSAAITRMGCDTSLTDPGRDRTVRGVMPGAPSARVLGQARVPALGPTELSTERGQVPIDGADKDPRDPSSLAHVHSRRAIREPREPKLPR